MIFNNNPEEKETDYFDGPDLPDPVKEPKQPVLQPDDPDYWNQEEPEFEHIRQRSRRVWVWWLVGAVVIIGLIIGIWLRFFSPIVEGGVQYGYVERIDKRGLVFKTFEGVVIPYKELFDTTRIYQRDFTFTAADAKIAAQLLRMQQSAIPVRMEYNRYNATLPWRGDSRIVVTRVDTADVTKILPPEFRPEYSPDGVSPDPIGEESGANVRGNKEGR